MNGFINYLLILPMTMCVTFYQIIHHFAFILMPRQFRRKKSIKGKNILITGAGSGLGRKLAVEFSKYSVCLILVDLNMECLHLTKELLNKGSSAFIYVCDVSDNKIVSKMAEKIKRDVGNIDILVNNAGIAHGRYLTDLSEEQIRQTLNVNTLAHFWTCKAFLPAMMEKNSGHIVSIASGAGKIGGSRVTDYCASKYAAIGFAESLEIELRERKKDGIKVTIVCPGHIDTGLFNGLNISISPPMQPEFVAQEIVSGILEDAETIFIPKYLGYLLLLKEFYPRWALCKLTELTGDIRCMSTFTGRTSEPDDNKMRKDN